MKYYAYMYDIIKKFAGNAKSLIDVGSNGTPFTEDLDWIPERYSLDIKNPYQSKNVTGVKADFFTFSPGKRYDAAICMQVLEHVQDPKVFAYKLLEMADHVFISVPYKWPVESNRSHKHDMIDIETMRRWAGRKPYYYLVVPEITDKPSAKAHRLICYYKNI